MSSSGRYLANGSLDSTIKLWNFERIVEDVEKSREKKCEILDIRGLEKNLNDIEFKVDCIKDNLL